MARTGNDYGPGGSTRDEFGSLPTKRIVKLQGVEAQTKSPISPTRLRMWVEDYVTRFGKMPKKLYHSGPNYGASGMGVTSNKLGFFWIDFVPGAERERLE